MSKNNSPFTLGSRGSVKGMKFSSAQGTDYFATKPDRISNPRTPKQQENRARMSLCTATGQKISDFINIAYKKRAYPKTNYNEFTSQNLSADKMSVVLDSSTNSYIASWLPASLSVKPNPSQKGLNTSIANADDIQIAVDFLVPQRSYTTYCIAQDAGGFVTGTAKATNVTNVSGKLSFTIVSQELGLPDLGAYYFSVVDDITGDVSNFTSIVV